MRGVRPALCDVDLAITRGESVALLGPNGSGKSTLIGAILREFYPLRREGSYLKILGEELWNIEDLRTRIGIVKNNLLPPASGIFSGRELVVSSFFSSVGLWNHQKPTEEMWSHTEEAMERVGAQHLADRDIDELSSGEARRLEIARALVHGPETLLLDEPTNHLDPGAQADLRRIVRVLIEQGTAVIIVTHHTSDVVPEINRVIMLRNGTIFGDGSRKDLLQSHVLSELFSHSVEVFERDGFVYTV
jgi:iron complex transport system ATP-binding protein